MNRKKELEERIKSYKKNIILEDEQYFAVCIKFNVEDWNEFSPTKEEVYRNVLNYNWNKKIQIKFVYEYKPRQLLIFGKNKSAENIKCYKISAIISTFFSSYLIYIYTFSFPGPDDVKLIMYLKKVKNFLTQEKIKDVETLKKFVDEKFSKNENIVAELNNKLSDEIKGTIFSLELDHHTLRKTFNEFDYKSFSDTMPIF